MKEITLTKHEMELAAIVGIKRRAESRASHRTDNKLLNTEKQGYWDVDIDGAAAEMAYCKSRNEYWSASIGTFKDADHGKKTQIRHTSYDNGKLIIRDDDKDDHFFVLVTGLSPNFKIHGWMLGSEGKKEEYLFAPNGKTPAYFIPQDKLNKFKEKP